MSVGFRWDPIKAATNLKKHRVTFTEASTVFSDPLARIFLDETHSDHERREILIGWSHQGRLLLVSFIEVAPDQIRIISARLANRRERRRHEEKKHETGP